jgi:hypothetical protein
MKYSITLSLIAAFTVLALLAYFCPNLNPFGSRVPIAPKWVASVGQPPIKSPPAVVDGSLTEDGYGDLGFPPVDRDWTDQDMAVAASKIKLLSASHREQLPVFQSSKSGRVFGKIVSPQSLGLAQAEVTEVQLRLN